VSIRCKRPEPEWDCNHRKKYRIEKDSLGEVKVPHNALYGAQTQRAVDNFAISGILMLERFIRSLGLIKAAAAKTNAELGELDEELAGDIYLAALRIAEDEYRDEFPVEIFQTGSGTSSNMNANEVIAALATEQLRRPVANSCATLAQTAVADFEVNTENIEANLARNPILVTAINRENIAVAQLESVVQPDYEAKPNTTST
jgi:fumarate hydratase class II